MCTTSWSKPRAKVFSFEVSNANKFEGQVKSKIINKCDLNNVYTRLRKVSVTLVEPVRNRLLDK